MEKRKKIEVLKEGVKKDKFDGDCCRASQAKN
jgi:hypothetical protein